MIVNSGLNLIRNWLANQTQTPPNHGAVGTGTIAEALTNTALQTEVGSRCALRFKTSENGIIDMIFTLLSTQGNLGNLTETGVFNASSAGTMFNRLVFIATNFNGTFNLKFTIKHTQKDV